MFRQRPMLGGVAIALVVALMGGVLFAAGRDGDELTAIAAPLHLGRRTQVWEVRVMNGERLAAFFVCTQMVLEKS